MKSAYFRYLGFGLTMGIGVALFVSGRLDTPLGPSQRAQFELTPSESDKIVGNSATPPHSELGTNDASQVTIEAMTPVNRLPPPSLATDAVLKRWGSGEFFAEHFAEEPIDPNWAPEMESRLQDAVAATGLTVISTQTHCRSSMCRIEIITNSNKSRKVANSDSNVRRITEAVRVARQTALTAGTRFPLSFTSADLLLTPASSPAEKGMAPPGQRLFIGYLWNRSQLPSRISPEILEILEQNRREPQN
jgi:hypothetical protein